MKTTVQYLDALKARSGLPSDYAAAKALDLTRGAVSRYRLGTSTFDDITAVRVAEILGIEPLEVIAAANIERAKDDGTRAMWAALWGKARGISERGDVKTTVQYLDAIKTRSGLRSDYAAAKALGVTRCAVSRYRLGLSTFDDTIAVRVAEILGVDPLEVIAAANLERAKDDGAHAIWIALWRKSRELSRLA
jgi:transcriptional regulator with XRE-family HTH domain